MRHNAGHSNIHVDERNYCSVVLIYHYFKKMIDATLVSTYFRKWDEMKNAI